MTKQHDRFLLEVCVESLEDALVAESAGADRIELNSALMLGGLTPSAGLVELVLKECSCDVVAMLRPRSAGFCYSAAEQRVMRRDAERLREQGARSITFGVLKPDRTIDIAACRAIMEGLEDLEFVFHRAFDCVPDPLESLETVVDLGFCRVLTAGGCATAPAGRDVLSDLQQSSRGRITVMPGSGIRPENLKELIEATGCREYHGSFSTPSQDFAGDVTSSKLSRVDEAMVRAARRILDSCSPHRHANRTSSESVGPQDSRN